MQVKKTIKPKHEEKKKKKRSGNNTFPFQSCIKLLRAPVQNISLYPTTAAQFYNKAFPCALSPHIHTAQTLLPLETVTLQSMDSSCRKFHFCVPLQTADP